MLLLRPYRIHVAHALYSARSTPMGLLRICTIVTLLIALACVIFGIMSWVLDTLLREKNFISIPAELIFIFCFNLFLPMIFFTNLSTFMGNFYYSEDLELILSSPLSRLRFFIQRTLLTCFESSWMTVFSLMPFIISICVNYKVSLLVLCILPFTLTVFLLVPASLASLAGVFWALVIPHIPPALIVVLILGGLVVIIRNILFMMGTYLENQNSIDFSVLNAIFTKIESFGLYWSPATWAAKSLAPFFHLPNNNTYSSFTIFDQFETHNIQTVIWSLVASISTIVLASSVAFLIFLHFYSISLGSMWGRKKKILYTIGPFANTMFVLIRNLFPAHRTLFGIIKKEAIEFMRDATQVIQLLFLFSFFGIYVYALQFQQSFQVLIGAGDSVMWRKILFVLNFSIETFMLVALSLRLTLPSLSREGRAAWIFQVSPIRSRTIIISKLIVLSFPIMTMMGFLSFFSHYVSTHDSFSSALKAVYILTVCTSIASYSMYIGAYFAYFSWESRSQLIASVGSIVFMLTGLLYAFLVVALSFPLSPLADTFKINNQFGVFAYWVSICSCNIIVSYICISKASRALDKKLHETII